MHKGTKIGLAVVALLACVVILALTLHFQKSPPKSAEEISDCLVLDGKDTCHSTDSSPYKYYGKKTTYETIMGNKPTESSGTENIEDKSCVPKVFYLLLRHGTRYPDRGDIVRINRHLPMITEKLINSTSEGKANICQRDLEKLKLWKPTIMPEDNSKLTDSGEIESIRVAEVFKKKFPQLLDKKYSPENFIFEYSSLERTQTTAEAFAKGVFPEEYMTIEMDGHDNDQALLFHKDCGVFQKQCNHTLINIDEVEKFTTGPIMTKLVDEVSNRIGFPVSYADVEIMYQACRNGYAIQENDIWCSVFSHDDLKVMEYEIDLNDYYRDAFGNEVAYKQACPLIKYVTDLFNSSLNETQPKSVFHFTHSGAIKKVYARFGLFRDSQPLTAKGPCFHQDRKWRSSFICPFSTSIAIMLFECKEGQKLMAFHNEQPVIIDGCKSSLCPLEDFFAEYVPIAQSCSIIDLCCACCKQ